MRDFKGSLMDMNNRGFSGLRLSELFSVSMVDICRQSEFNSTSNMSSVPKWPVYGRARPSRRAFVENRPSNARIFVILPVYI